MLIIKLFFFFIFTSAFDDSWCEPPYLDYPMRNDADLVMVQILTRHGARTPLHQSLKYPHVWQCNNTEYFSQSNINIHSPLRVFVSESKSIFLGDCHFGQLISKGANALQRLGKHIRWIYVDQMKFLPSRFNPNIIRFRSTKTHRTLHSQMNFILGLYPNMNIEYNSSITIIAPEKSIDPLRHLPAVCTNLKKAVQEVQKSDEFIQKFSDRKKIWTDVGNVLGVKAKSAPDIVMSARCNYITDSLPMYNFGKNHLYSSFNLDNSDITNSSTSIINEDVLDSASLLKAEQQKYIFMHPKVFPLKFSFAIAEMANLMIDRINGNSKIRFIHWSAHDGDIFGFLGYLGTGSDKLPPYGSYIITELWKFRHSGEFFLRFIYNGKVLRVPRLGNIKNVLFDDFLRFVKVNMPSLKVDCGFSHEKFKNAWTFQPEEH
ncbi:2-phosphoxylose phosphatase 1 [Tritrichomonas musculus]|uniref:2-phosphoxylose phosphatase 1 n=1 Tax=Tritrichomonas musculus TaxID=1915356 RepID=A0ABR2IZ65_9EUKA